MMHVDDAMRRRRVGERVLEPRRLLRRRRDSVGFLRVGVEGEEVHRSANEVVVAAAGVIGVERGTRDGAVEVAQVRRGARRHCVCRRAFVVVVAERRKEPIVRRCGWVARDSCRGTDR